MRSEYCSFSFQTLYTCQWNLQVYSRLLLWPSWWNCTSQIFYCIAETPTVDQGTSITNSRFTLENKSELILACFLIQCVLQAGSNISVNSSQKCCLFILGLPLHMYLYAILISCSLVWWSLSWLSVFRASMQLCVKSMCHGAGSDMWIPDSLFLF